MTSAARPDRNRDEARRQKRLRSSGQNDSHALAHAHAKETDFFCCSNQHDSRRGEEKVEKSKEGKRDGASPSFKSYIRLGHGEIHGMGCDRVGRPKFGVEQRERTPAMSGYWDRNALPSVLGSVILYRLVFVLGSLKPPRCRLVTTDDCDCIVATSQSETSRIAWVPFGFACLQLPVASPGS